MLKIDISKINNIVLTNTNDLKVANDAILIEFYSSTLQKSITFSSTASTINDRYHDYTIGTASLINLDASYTDYNIYLYATPSNILLDSGKVKVDGITSKNTVTDYVRVDTIKTYKKL